MFTSPEAGARAPEAAAAVEAMLPCVDEVLQSAVIAQLHRYRGLYSFKDDAARAQQAFAAARALEPSYKLPGYPEGHPMLSAYNALPTDGPEEPVEPPAEGRLLLDGLSATARPTDRAALFQYVDGAGAVQQTAYLWPADPTPSYPVAEAPQAAATSELPPPAAELTPQRPAWVGWALVATSGAAAAVSGVSYAISSRSAEDYWSDEVQHTETELDDLRSTTNSAAVLSAGAGVVALGAGVGAAFTLDW